MLHLATLRPQNKAHFRRFMDSVLQKATKLKVLLKDLKDNYEPETAKQCLNSTSELNILDHTSNMSIFHSLSWKKTTA